MSNLTFWAKTTDDRIARPDSFHPLICHLIDVATVTKKMWQDVLPVATKVRINEAFAVEDAETLVSFIAGLHDLGKASPPFALRGISLEHDQKYFKDSLARFGNEESFYADRIFGRLQSIWLLDLYRNTPFWVSAPMPASQVPHGYVTAVELPEILISYFNFSKHNAKQIATLIGGHHGVFPTSPEIKYIRKKSVDAIGSEPWKIARKELVFELANLINPILPEDTSSITLDNSTIMILAGLVSVADWIGSNTDFFKCAATFQTDKTTQKAEIDFEFENLESYFKHAESKASEALFQLGWVNPKQPIDGFLSLGGSDTFTKLFPTIDERRDLQEKVIEISDEIEGPGIAVIEAPTGEGKTEAAMYLANAWNQNLDQTGYYFALPTQATSNQMYERVASFLEERYPDSDVNLQLTHGHASLSEEFKRSKANAKNRIQGIADDQCGDDCASNVVAAEWFTYRKRPLLAPFGVGTIDQALMAILQTKHAFVRLFGLAHKTIILDEVHAYDAYMSTLIERLLEWLAALGSPVVLLSATLPKARRDVFIRAYQRGLQAPPNDSVERDSENKSADHYPRISYSFGETTRIKHLETSAHNQRKLRIEIRDDDFVADLKSILLSGGGCVAIICNTVNRAQELFSILSEDEFFAGIANDGKPKLDLLHSRFRYIDRKERENRCLSRFGKPDSDGNNVDRPDCAVLISTQIIEQSLDLDFDLMITDLAPIDLILQRAGRLHRHNRKQRPASLQKPILWILKPEFDDNQLPNFVRSIVYDNHILLRTWLEINKPKFREIAIPEMVEELVEAVYSEQEPPTDLEPEISSFWNSSKVEIEKNLSSDAASAKNRYIKHPHYRKDMSRIFRDALEEDSPEFHPSVQAKTRQIEATVSVVCLWNRDERVYLDENYKIEIDLEEKPPEESLQPILERSLNVSNRGVVFKLLEEDVPKGWRHKALLRHQRILKFDENRECKRFGFVFRLDQKLGLQITKKGEKDV